MQDIRLEGVITPVLTPYNDDLTIAEDLYLDHAAGCLAAGTHYLSPFGTTGEAVSNTPAKRMAMLERLIESGTATPDQLLPGTGLCSLDGTLELTRHAARLGVAAAMVLPTFFYADASDEGVFRFYAQLIERLGAGAPRLCLYNIPQNTGIAVSPAVAARLRKDFPDIVVAYKDSSGDWANTAALIEAAPGLAVFPASESLLAPSLEIGAAGCISATCNSNAANIRKLYDQLRSGGGPDPALASAIDAHRKAVQQTGLIPGLKSLKAHLSGDRRWLNTRPPLVNADPALGERLAATIAPASPIM